MNTEDPKEGIMKGWTGMWIAMALSMILGMGSGYVLADGEDGSTGATTAVKPQSTCPVMGGKINKDMYVDAKGYRIYVCCGGCIPAMEKDPDKYIKKVQEAGETLAKAPKVLCGKCGEIKGTEACCSKDAAKCKGCGLIKGSPGCCRIEKGKDVELCGKCNEIKSSAACGEECKSKKGGQGCC
jgi:hypothetical protein